MKQLTPRWLLLRIAVAALSSMPLGAADYRHDGDQSFFITSSMTRRSPITTKTDQQNPNDPISYNDLASAQLNKEMSRLGLLDSSALGRDNRFLRIGTPQADPRARAFVLDTLDRGRRTAETVLAREARNALALYSLCTNYGLRATYEFMIDRAWFAALRDGSKARSYCAQAKKSQPEQSAGYKTLVLGVCERTQRAHVPLPVKLLAMGGLHGSKKKGIEYVSFCSDRDAARAAVYRSLPQENTVRVAVLQLIALSPSCAIIFPVGACRHVFWTPSANRSFALSTLKSLLCKDRRELSGDDRCPEKPCEGELSSSKRGDFHFVAPPQLDPAAELTGGC